MRRPFDMLLNSADDAPSVPLVPDKVDSEEEVFGWPGIKEEGPRLRLD